ncbi:MAG: hypothetical protein AABY22_26785 [Nanoarchaeota archaeon]
MSKIRADLNKKIEKIYNTGVQRGMEIENPSPKTHFRYQWTEELLQLFKDTVEKAMPNYTSFSLKQFRQNLSKILSEVEVEKENFMSWISCEKCKAALEWGDLYCWHCGSKNSQGKKDWQKSKEESKQYEGQQEENLENEKAQ